MSVERLLRQYGLVPKEGMYFCCIYGNTYSVLMIGENWIPEHVTWWIPLEGLLSVID